MDEQTREHGTIGETRFEATLKLLAGATGRRAALRALAASAFGGALVPLFGPGDGTEEAAAKRRKRRTTKQRRRHDRKRGRAQKKLKKEADDCAKAGQKPKPQKPCCPGLIEGEPGRCAPCHVCASGCPFTEVQAAIDHPSQLFTITICPGTYAELLTIDRDLTLSGAGDGADELSDTIIDTEVPGSVVTVAAGATVTLHRLRVRGGAGTPGEFGAVGGGINNHGDLTLSDCTVSDSTADLGGGIYNVHGSLTLSESTVTANTASDSGGGIRNQGGTVTLEASVVEGNTSGFGGGIDNENGTLTLSNSSVNLNTATQVGGGLFVDGASTVTLTGATVVGNTATAEGGGIATDDLPGVLTLTLIDSTVSGNTGRSGGGIFNVGDLTLSGSTVRENRATTEPGFPPGSGDGGGIFNNSLGILTIEASSVTLNQAADEGGGIYNAGSVDCSDPGTVSGNTAATGANCFDAGGGDCATCNPPA